MEGAQEKQERMLSPGLVDTGKESGRAGGQKAGAQQDAAARQKAREEHDRSARPPWFSQRTLSAEGAEAASAFRRAFFLSNLSIHEQNLAAVLVSAGTLPNDEA